MEDIGDERGASRRNAAEGRMHVEPYALRAGIHMTMVNGCKFAPDNRRNELRSFVCSHISPGADRIFGVSQPQYIKYQIG